LAGWTDFIAAFTVFFASHAIPVRPRVKGAIVARIGARGFSLVYSALSVAVLTWLIVAAGRAPFIMLWPWAAWQLWVPVIVNAIAMVILALGTARPNPLSFGGAHNEQFDPADPGIVGWMRHPLLVAIGLWAAAHMVPNGDLAHVLLFGTFLGFAGLGTRIIDRRKRRQMGAEWDRLTKTARRVNITPGGLLRIAVGLGLYGLVLWLHAPVIGVSPLP
jgi:uncharacterized membrane protein